jgi:hypothetical protein
MEMGSKDLILKEMRHYRLDIYEILGKFGEKNVKKKRSNFLKPAQRHRSFDKAAGVYETKSIPL